MTDHAKEPLPEQNSIEREPLWIALQCLADECSTAYLGGARSEALRLAIEYEDDAYKKAAAELQRQIDRKLQEREENRLWEDLRRIRSAIRGRL